MRSLLLTLLALMLLVPPVALASDDSVPEKEPLIEVIPFGEDPQTTAERLHEQGLHEHPKSETDPQPILKEKEDQRFQLYYPGDDKRVGLRIKIRLWTFKPDSDGVTKKFYIKPKISDEPRLMFTFKF